MASKLGLLESLWGSITSKGDKVICFVRSNGEFLDQSVSAQFCEVKDEILENYDSELVECESLGAFIVEK